MTDLEAARAELERAEVERGFGLDPVKADAYKRAKIRLAVQIRMAEDVAEHKARQARFMRKVG